MYTFLLYKADDNNHYRLRYNTWPFVTYFTLGLHILPYVRFVPFHTYFTLL